MKESPLGGQAGAWDVILGGREEGGTSTAQARLSQSHYCPTGQTRCLHFTEDGDQAQRGWFIPPRLHSCQRLALGC